MTNAADPARGIVRGVAMDRLAEVRRMMAERDVLLGIDHLDNQRQVVAELQQVCRVQHALGAEAGQAAEDGSAGESLAPQSLDERGGKRLALEAVILADVNANQPLFAVQNAHG